MAFNKRLEVIIGPDGGQGVLIKDLYIKFEVKKSDSESMNSAEVEIYNLSNETIDKINKAGNKIVIRAGYLDEGLSPLFFGNIIQSIVRKEGGERILKIDAQDGEKSYSKKKISLSYKEGTKAFIIADAIMNNLGLPVFGRENINRNIEYTIGYSFIGMAKTALSEVLAHCKCSWTIQNESIVIISEGGTIQDTGLLLSADSGLVELNPAEEENNKSGKKKIKKMTVKTLLFPQLVPGSKCKIISKAANINAFFKVRSGKYFGDNRGGDFFNELEVDVI